MKTVKDRRLLLAAMGIFAAGRWLAPALAADLETPPADSHRVNTVSAKPTVNKKPSISRMALRPSRFPTTPGLFRVALRYEGAPRNCSLRCGNFLVLGVAY